MAFWFWLVIGWLAGCLPWWGADARARPALARQWWHIIFGLALVGVVLPFGIVLAMFLSDLAFDAIVEMAALLWHDDFRWLTGLSAGALAGSGVTAWFHRAPTRELIQPAPVTPREPAGPLEWMYAGFTSAWYIALAVAFAFTVRSSDNYFIAALAFFIFIPSMFAGFCGVCPGVTSAAIKETLRIKFQQGAFTRQFCFGAGFLAGVSAIAGVVAACVVAYSISHSEAGIWIAFGGIGAILTASPFLGLLLLRMKS